ncbi:hypothetical protein LOK49_LG02G00437 [Camellia lanceoleosa]|uniref:Uncharacterized protein n=1 Tax=Camellia lanceoleosa TaxID=1840588 RepID=A0ACC0INV7_9ERIC|nr:hypothetical protein LOK49_LG02G00437 [Camellia lanceoleosa]
MLREEAAKGLSSEKVKKLEAEIKEEIVSAMEVVALKEKVENLRAELESSTKAVTGDDVLNNLTTLVVDGWQL